jgi:hypothetical protein
MHAIAREVTTLALVCVKQGGRLNVHQREGLRRALARAGEELGWAVTVASREDPVAVVMKNVTGLVDSGTIHLERAVADELAEKKHEEDRLRDVVETLQALAEDSAATYPVEISYSHTARDGSRGLVTKTETISVADADEALAVASTIEKGMGRWVKLRAQMLDELKQKQTRLGELKDDVSEFFELSRGLVGDILVTLP